MGRNVLVLVRHSPRNGDRAAEALRMAVGLEIYDNRVTVAFLDAGVLAAAAAGASGPSGEGAPSGEGTPSGEAAPSEAPGAGVDALARPIETLALLGHRLWAEAESLARFGLDPAALPPGVEAVPGERVLAAMLECDAVLSL